MIPCSQAETWRDLAASYARRRHWPLVVEFAAAGLERLPSTDAVLAEQEALRQEGMSADSNPFYVPRPTEAGRCRAQCLFLQARAYDELECFEESMHSISAAFDLDPAEGRISSFIMTRMDHLLEEVEAHLSDDSADEDEDEDGDEESEYETETETDDGEEEQAGGGAGGAENGEEEQEEEKGEGSGAKKKKKNEEEEDSLGGDSGLGLDKGSVEGGTGVSFDKAGPETIQDVPEQGKDPYAIRKPKKQGGDEQGGGSGGVEEEEEKETTEKRRRRRRRKKKEPKVHLHLHGQRKKQEHDAATARRKAALQQLKQMHQRIKRMRVQVRATQRTL